jgi:hypothetical protein
LRVTRRTSRTSEAGKRRDAKLPGCSSKGDATRMTDTPPDYARQNGEPLSDEAALRWCNDAATEARSVGCRIVRYSVHQTIKHLRLVEGWTEISVQQGEPAWSLRYEMGETQ